MGNKKSSRGAKLLNQSQEAA